MIISHTHRFIYIRTHKTASTSLMTALVPYLAPTDAILDHPGLPFKGRNWTIGEDFAHWPLTLAIERGQITPEQARDYTVWTVERNPWDKLWSGYKFYQRLVPDAMTSVTFEDFIRGKGPFAPFSDWHLYAGNTRVFADWIGEYEDMSKTERYVSDLLGEPFVLNQRLNAAPERDSYVDHYTPEMVEIVANLSRREIELCGYEFGE